MVLWKERILNCSRRLLLGVRPDPHPKKKKKSAGERYAQSHLWFGGWHMIDFGFWILDWQIRKGNQDETALDEGQLSGKKHYQSVHLPVINFSSSFLCGRVFAVEKKY